MTLNNKHTSAVVVDTGSVLAPMITSSEGLDSPSVPCPLRLLFVADSLNVGGAERHVVGLASAMVAQGHHVTIACTIEGALASLANEAGVIITPLMPQLMKRQVSLGFARALKRLMLRQHFDIVHAHMYASAVAAAFATVGTQIPLIITEHSEAAWRSNHARRYGRLSYRHAAHVIAVSSAIRHRLIEHDQVPAEKVSVIPNSLFPLPLAPVDAAALLPFAFRSAPLIGVVARLQPEKGVAFFLQAAARIVHAVPEAHFIIIGDGPLCHDLQELARRLGLSDRVFFAGFRLDAAAFVPFLTALVVPSLSEGTPLVVLEGMAAGVPVVASDVGGIPEQISHGCEGLLVPPGDATAISDAIIRLLHDPILARHMGEAGRLRSATQFSAPAMLRQTEAIYRVALGHPSWDVVSPATEVYSYATE